MKNKKTSQKQRNVYRYPVNVEDGRGGYRTSYITIKPGEEGVTEAWIQVLHGMDDNEVANNANNGRHKFTAEQKAAKKKWERSHPEEKYETNWNLSLDCIAEELEDGNRDMSSVIVGTCYNPFEEQDASDEVLKLREITAAKMTASQRQAYELIGLEEYSESEAAEIMGIDIAVVKILYDKAIKCIKKNF